MPPGAALALAGNIHSPIMGAAARKARLKGVTPSGDLADGRRSGLANTSTQLH